jgi:hypothetical protein
VLILRIGAGTAFWYSSKSTKMKGFLRAQSPQDAPPPKKKNGKQSLHVAYAEIERFTCLNGRCLSLLSNKGCAMPNKLMLSYTVFSLPSCRVLVDSHLVMITQLLPKLSKLHLTRYYTVHFIHFNIHQYKGLRLEIQLTGSRC